MYYGNVISLIIYFGVMIGGFLCGIIERAPFLLLVIAGMTCGGLYCLKIELYRATYIYIDTENRKLYIKTMFKGDFEYDFSQIKVVLRRNYGARFEFNDGRKIEFNRVHVEIETAKGTFKSMRNIEESDLPGVHFIKKL